MAHKWFMSCSLCRHREFSWYKKRWSSLEVNAGDKMFCLHSACQWQILTALIQGWKPESRPKGRKKRRKKQTKKKTNPLILFPYQAALNLTHSDWEWRRGWKQCQVVKSVANSNLHFPPPSSAQSPLRASSFLQSHPDASCLHLSGNSLPFDHLLILAKRTTSGRRTFIFLQ